MAASVAFVTPHWSSDEEKTYPIPATDGVQIDKGNAVILMRIQGKLYAFSLACPHQNTALKWHGEDNQFECPKHHSKYRPDGSFIEGRATRGMDRYAISRTPAGITVDLDKVYEQDADEKEWTGSVLHV